mmetsp:Transcript_57908/g.154762  ORF Transcript_57908/g.154762 Transcript_57908/m.154762 type:complete len:481 (-) Transcript_57908:193-1635(-)
MDRCGSADSLAQLEAERDALEAGCRALRAVVHEGGDDEDEGAGELNGDDSVSLGSLGLCDSENGSDLGGTVEFPPEGVSDEVERQWRAVDDHYFQSTRAHSRIREALASSQASLANKVAYVQSQLTADAHTRLSALVQRCLDRSAQSDQLLEKVQEEGRQNLEKLEAHHQARMKKVMREVQVKQEAAAEARVRLEQLRTQKELVLGALSSVTTTRNLVQLGEDVQALKEELQATRATAEAADRLADANRRKRALVTQKAEELAAVRDQGRAAREAAEETHRKHDELQALVTELRAMRRDHDAQLWSQALPAAAHQAPRSGWDENHHITESLKNKEFTADRRSYFSSPPRSRSSCAKSVKGAVEKGASGFPGDTLVGRKSSSPSLASCSSDARLLEGRGSRPLRSSSVRSFHSEAESKAARAYRPLSGAIGRAARPHTGEGGLKTRPSSAQVRRQPVQATRQKTSRPASAKPPRTRPAAHA